MVDVVDAHSLKIDVKRAVVDGVTLHSAHSLHGVFMVDVNRAMVDVITLWLLGKLNVKPI